MLTDNVQEQAIFRSAKSALSFALNFKHGTIKASGLTILMSGAKRAGRDLTGLDGAGMAGMIRAEVGAIELPTYQHILIARYAVRAVPCSCGRICCAGLRSNLEWVKSVSYLGEAALLYALAGCKVSYQLRHAMVRRYFGVHTGLSEAAAIAGVDRDTASAHMSKIAAWLKADERHAYYAIEGRLKVAGIVE